MRTESEILSKSPIKAKLGDKEYKIPILTVIPAREWRMKLDADMAGLTGSLPVVEAADAPTISRGLTFALIQFPEKVADLVFLYRTYGSLWESVVKEGIPDSEWYSRFLVLLEQKPPQESPDFPRNSILATATEEQLASAFASIMQVAYPFMPQLATVMQVMRAIRQLPENFMNSSSPNGASALKN